ncbi:hypothetical protein [Marinobacter sp. SS8-8]|uniref:hypothetical protein n=1 Tax=Marinobacter sp. SS8-8 TaxID=3050452 RepID=UPI000C4569BB|nr:hypothetical protein [Marinobacter sp. SS8-8]MAZ04848.1 hypothetical protein [Halomonas sp.]|tara:strand:+ start:17117 stop:17449 length:333 start_codon:yes stop_codon:yes gene_type:complete
MTRKISRTLVATVAACLLAFSSLGYAQAVDESPSALAMASDAVFIRPALLATTIVGSAVYLVSLPFSLLGGNADEAGEVLVMGPARATFVRCLGCTRTGRKPETIEPANN